jgi:hypothetical protein
MLSNSLSQPLAPRQSRPYLRGQGSIPCSPVSGKMAKERLDLLKGPEGPHHGYRRLNGEPNPGRINLGHGWVAEWFKAAVLKTAKGLRLSWVRIPPHPEI